MIKILKISSGEEIVGELIPSQTNIIIKKPMVIVYRYHPMSTFPSVKLVKYMLFSKDENFRFSHLDVINITDPKESFIEYYLHVINCLGDEVDKNIDSELREAIKADKQIKDRFYSHLLEQMPVPENLN